VTALTDNLLLERIRQGDTTSFETLFYRHYGRVYGLLFRLVSSRGEAEELTQEAFIKLYRHAYTAAPLQKIKSAAVQEQNISAWLYRVATILRLVGLSPEKCIMIGDRLETDVLMGQEAGIASALTLTGATGKAALVTTNIQPTYVLQQLGDLIPTSRR